jgi:hypothetical protein
MPEPITTRANAAGHPDALLAPLGPRVVARPWLARSRRWMGRPSDFRMVSERSWLLAPAVRRRARPALFDPRDLDRVTGLQEHTTRELELVRISGGWRDHGATRAHRFRNVRLVDGHLFGARLVMSLGQSPAPWVAEASAAHVASAVLVASAFGIRYFGHWMHDDLPCALAAARLDLERVRPRYAPHAHQSWYESTCGVRIRDVPDTAFDELIVLDDEGQNDDKRRRFQDIRERVRAGRMLRRHRGVLYLRGRTGARRALVNEDEVAAALAREDFVAILPGAMDCAGLMDAALESEIVVSVEGSQMTHALATLRDGGTLIALQPPDRFNNNYADLCDCVGLRYGFIVGEPVEGGFRVDIPRLLALLDRTA